MNTSLSLISAEIILATLVTSFGQGTGKLQFTWNSVASSSPASTGNDVLRTAS